MDRLRPAAINASEEIKDLKRKVRGDERAVEKVREDEAAHGDTLDSLATDVAEAEGATVALREEYETARAAEGGGGTNDDGSSVTLTEEQEIEYERVKEAAAMASVRPRQILDRQNRKLETARIRASNFEEELREARNRKEETVRNAAQLTKRRDELEA